MSRANMDYYLSSTQFMAPKVVILFSYQFISSNIFEVFDIVFADCINRTYIIKDINQLSVKLSNNHSS